MKRFLLAIVLLFACGSLVLARAKIPLKARVTNEYPGYCAWASLETMCRHQHIRKGYDLLQKRKLDPDYVYPDGSVLEKRLGSDDAICDKLKELGIKFKLHRSRNWDQDGIDQIKKAVDSGRGALVGVYHGWPTTEECHAIVIIDWFQDTYEYIDTNNPGVIYEGTRDYFEDEWTGLVVTLDK